MASLQAQKINSDRDEDPIDVDKEDVTSVEAGSVGSAVQQKQEHPKEEDGGRTLVGGCCRECNETSSSASPLHPTIGKRPRLKLGGHSGL